MKTKKAVHLTFPKKMIKEPVIYNLGHKFRIITNIIKANITHDEGWVILELDGDDAEIEKSINWLKSFGITVSPPGIDEN